MPFTLESGAVGGVEVPVKQAGGPFGEGDEVGGKAAALRSEILLKARSAAKAILDEVSKRGEAEEWGGKCNSEVAVEAENGS